MTLPDLILTGQKGVRVPPGAYRTISIVNCSDVTLAGVSVDFTPDGETTVDTPVVSLSKCSRVTIKDCMFVGRPVPEGTPKAQRVTDQPYPGANALLVGMASARCIDVQGSTDITITGCDISGFQNGILLKTSSKVAITRNRIHHMRATPIRGSASVSDILIQDNDLHDITPWRWPDNHGGDHSDFIHLFTLKGQKPAANIRIVGNRLWQGAGVSTRGIILEDRDGATYVGVDISDNLFLVGETQAIAVQNTTGRVDRNLMLAPKGSKGFGTIFLVGASTPQTVSAEGNTMYERSTKPFQRDMYPKNTILSRSVDTSAMIDAAILAWEARVFPLKPAVPMTLAEVQAKVDALWAKVFP